MNAPIGAQSPTLVLLSLGLEEMKNRLLWTSLLSATTLFLENHGWINMIQLSDGKILLSHSLPYTVNKTVHTIVKQSPFTRGHRLQSTTPVLSLPSPALILLLCNHNRSINAPTIPCRRTLTEYLNPVLNPNPTLNPNLTPSPARNPNPVLSPTPVPSPTPPEKLLKYHLSDQQPSHVL